MNDQRQVPDDHGDVQDSAVERLREQVSPHLLISEIRTIAQDDLWMSTAYGRPSVAIHFTWKPDWPAVRRVLPLVEKQLAPFAPQPHWAPCAYIPFHFCRASAWASLINLAMGLMSK